MSKSPVAQERTA